VAAWSFFDALTQRLALQEGHGEERAPVNPVDLMSRAYIVVVSLAAALASRSKR